MFWNTQQLRRHPLIIGHRGAPSLAPENTLASFHAAVSEGADAVEIDVQLTRDGRFVVFHDSNLFRLSGLDLRIADIDLSQFRSIVPQACTLDEVLAELPDTVGILIDTKISDPSVLGKLEEHCLDSNARERIMLGISSDATAISILSMRGLPKCALFKTTVPPETLCFLGLSWTRIPEKNNCVDNITEYHEVGLRTIFLPALDPGGKDTRIASRPDLELVARLRPSAILLDNPGDASRCYPPRL